MCTTLCEMHCTLPLDPVMPLKIGHGGDIVTEPTKP